MSNVHTLIIRFDLASKEKAESFFSRIDDFFPDKKGAWDNHSWDILNKAFGNDFDYIHEYFGNFMHGDSSLDIAVLDVNDKFEETDILLFYSGEFGEYGTLLYLIRNENCDVFSVHSNISSPEELSAAVKKEIEFMEFVTTVHANAAKSFHHIRKLYLKALEKNVDLDFVREALEEKIEDEDEDDCA